MKLKKAKNNSIHIIALAALGGGLSGGDRIFIELARRWSKTRSVHLYVWEQGREMCVRENLSGDLLKIHVIKVGLISKLGFLAHYLYRILLGIKLGLSLKIAEGDLIYSASEFWMDSLPALIGKLRSKKAKWAAAWYQTAPNPVRGFSEGSRKKQYKWSAFLYWFMQKPIKPLINRYADVVLVNNELERKYFPALEKAHKVAVVLGAVDTEKINNYLKKYKDVKEKKYLGVFQGRFHPQKGVVELIDIWKKVVQKLPEAKLAMIGDGPLMGDVKKRIRELHLDDNIDLYGYLHDGDLKYSIFMNSLIVLHPAFFDSGGMASAEAMAFGLPCIGFDLKAYESYYPKGMLKVPSGNLNVFAEEILMLLKNRVLYNKVAKEAREMVFRDFSWEKRSLEVLSKIKS